MNKVYSVEHKNMFQGDKTHYNKLFSSKKEAKEYFNSFISLQLILFEKRDKRVVKCEDNIDIYFDNLDFISVEIIENKNV